MTSIAIILPALNEAACIEDTIRDFHAELPEATIVVVDNASNDGTREIAVNTLAELGARGFVVDELRRGKGNAMRRGLKSVNADIYLVADADLTYPAKHARELIDPILHNRADVVVGDRISNGKYEAENKRPFHHLGNRLVCSLINNIFGAQLNDIMSGYRAMCRNFVHNYPIVVQGFQVETDLTLYALDKHFRVLEVPIDYRDRPAGSWSKLNTYADGARVLMTIVTIFRHYRPMLFFGLIALLFALGSIVCGIPVLQEWFEHRYINRVPLAVLASGLALMSGLSFSLGLILDSIVFQHRMDLERNIRLPQPRTQNEADEGPPLP